MLGLIMDFWCYYLFTAFLVTVFFHPRWVLLGLFCAALYLAFGLELLWLATAFDEPLYVSLIDRRMLFAQSVNATAIVMLFAAIGSGIVWLRRRRELNRAST